MVKQKIKTIKRDRRRARIRAQVKGTDIRPRFSVFKSNKGMYLQLVDDSSGRTLISVSSAEIKGSREKTKTSFELGKLIAAKAARKNIKSVVFDRGGYKYHGRIKAVADGAREGGLKF